MSSINDLQMMISTNPLYNKEIDRYKNSDLPTVDFADYLVEQGIFSSKEELMKYIRDTSIFYDDEKNAANSTNNQTVEIGGKNFIKVVMRRSGFPLGRVPRRRTW